MRTLPATPKLAGFLVPWLGQGACDVQLRMVQGPRGNQQVRRARRLMAFALHMIRTRVCSAGAVALSFGHYDLRGGCNLVIRLPATTSLQGGGR